MVTTRITMLREKKQELLAGLDLIESLAKDRVLTSAEQKGFDEDLAEINAINADLDRHEALRAADERAVNANPPALPRRPGEPAPGDVARPRGARYADLFGTPKSSAFKTSEEFLRAVHRAHTVGMFDPRLGGPDLKATMLEGIPGSGGFAVPEPLAATWLDVGLEDEVVRPRASVYPMIADSLKVPGWDDTDHTTSIAGFTMSWLAEGQGASGTDGKVRRIRLEAKKGMCATTLSNEMLEDGGQSFNGELGAKMAGAVSWYMDYAFLNGTGSGQPLGILNDPALVTITKEAGQPTGTFFYENAVKMYERLAPGGYGNAVWIVNHSVVPQLLTMSVKIKNVAGTENVGGSMVPVLTADGDGQLRLLGLPVVKTEKVPALSTKGDVILADLSQYAVGLRREVQLEGSRHVGWSTDTTSYRAVVRVDGQGTWNKPLTVKAGTSRSWCVVVENR